MDHRRRSIKLSESDTREKLRRNCRDIGRQHRQELLQQHRSSMSPGDLQVKLHAGTMAAIRAELNQPDQEGAVLTDADINALLADVQQLVMQEIEEELAALERFEQQDMQHTTDMAEEHMQYLQSVGEDAVPCPVCKAAHLVTRHGWLVCPAEGWQLNLAAESLQLSDLKQRLAAAYEEHTAAGCPGQLQFHIEDLFGSQSLTCSCDSCQALTVVL